MPFLVQGQNLVPNGGLESFTICPDFWNQVDQAVGWQVVRGSPDYYNSCDASEFASVPSNVVGDQAAHEGQAYAGGYLWCDFPANSREILGIELVEPLTPNVPVFVSFRVSPTTGGPLESMRWTSSGAGARFSMEPYVQSGADPLPDQAAVHMTAPPHDTLAWYEVSGWFTPDSAYTFVALGNFFSDSFTLVEELNPGGTHPCAYVYYDRLCVSYNESGCGFPDMIGEQTRTDFRFAPNPFTEKGWLRLEEPLAGPCRVTLFDALGRNVWDQAILAGTSDVEISGSTLLGGSYVVHIEYKEQPFTRMRIVKL